MIKEYNIFVTRFDGVRGFLDSTGKFHVLPEETILSIKEEGILEYINYKANKLADRTLPDNLPYEVICLSCLCTQPTQRIINNDHCCIKCDCRIDLGNLSDIEV